MSDIETSTIILSLTAITGLVVWFIKKHEKPEESELVTEQIEALHKIIRHQDKRNRVLEGKNEEQTTIR